MCEPKKVTGNHLLLVLGVGLSLVAVFTVIAAVGDNSSDEPTAETQTRTAMDSVWVGMDTGERVAFCTDARASGYTVVVSELSSGTDYDEREVRYWLEDRCS